MVREGIPFFRGRWKKMLLISVLGTVRTVLFFVAFVYATMGNAVVMFYTFPIFAAGFGFLIIRERTSLRQRLLLGMAFTGILLAFSNQEFSFQDRDCMGMTAALLSAIVYALTVVLFKSESQNYSLKELVFYQNLAGLLLLWPFFEWQVAGPQDYALGLSYGLLIGVGVFTLFFYGLKRLKAATASALMYMEVVSATLAGILVMGEPISWNLILGGLLIIGSSLLLKRR
jgi:drug/metabolite transporter (DMT)-like permease